MKNLLMLSATFCAIVFIACKKNNVDDWRTIKKLYRIYNSGSISECKLSGEKVFIAGIDAYDAGATIYNKNGDKIGLCNYGWGPVDSICGQLKDCENIYHVKDNISGQPEVDKYNLNRGLFR